MRAKMSSNKLSHQIGIKDVASKANVSIATVSNVLNGTKPVSEELSKRVLTAASDLHYNANTIAKGLKSGRTYTIAVVVHSITSVFFPPLLKSIQTAAEEKNYSVLVYGTDGSLHQEEECIKRLQAQAVDGILLSSCLDTDSRSAARYIEFLSHLISNGHPLPLVCLESAIGEHLDAVVSDDKEGIIQLVNHLFSIGKKKIAYIAAPVSYSVGKSRIAGFRQAMLNHGISSDSLTIEEGDFSPESGYTAMQKILTKEPHVDGVVAGNDQMAAGALRCLLDHKINVPATAAVVGYDDNFTSSIISPALTTIHVPREEMGRMSFELLERRIGNPEKERMLIRLTGKLIIRNSTDPAVKTPWNLRGW